MATSQDVYLDEPLPKGFGYRIRIHTEMNTKGVNREKTVEISYNPIDPNETPEVSAAKIQNALARCDNVGYLALNQADDKERIAQGGTARFSPTGAVKALPE